MKSCVTTLDLGADAVLELLLTATENHGVGQFGSVTYVQPPGD
jgi:hypothetical protein